MPSITLTPAPPTTLKAPTSAELSKLRLVAVPGDWPPYDCETHGAACPAAREAAATNPAVSSQAQGPVEPRRAAAPPPAPGQDRIPGTPASTAPADAAARAGDLARAGRAAPAGDLARAGRAAPAGDLARAGRAAPAGTASGAPGHASAGQATALPRQFAQVIVEILAGSRPLRQTVGWTTDRVRTQIGDLTQVLASDQRPRIRRIMTSQPAASVVEMTVVVNFGPRSRALAMRFEHMPARRPAPGLPTRPERWLCTEIEAG